jgi:hypothetical protein
MQVMRKKKAKKSVKQELINLLQHRIKLLEIEKQHYGQNPTLMRNLKMANIELIQNDLATLRKILNEMTLP